MITIKSDSGKIFKVPKTYSSYWQQLGNLPTTLPFSSEEIVVWQLLAKVVSSATDIATKPKFFSLIDYFTVVKLAEYLKPDNDTWLEYVCIQRGNIQNNEELQQAYSRQGRYIRQTGVFRPYHTQIPYVCDGFYNNFFVSFDPIYNFSTIEISDDEVDMSEYYIDPLDEETRDKLINADEMNIIAGIVHSTYLKLISHREYKEKLILPISYEMPVSMVDWNTVVTLVAPMLLSSVQRGDSRRRVLMQLDVARKGLSEGFPSFSPSPRARFQAYADKQITEPFVLISSSQPMIGQTYKLLTFSDNVIYDIEKVNREKINNENTIYISHPPRKISKYKIPISYINDIYSVILPNYLTWNVKTTGIEENRWEKLSSITDEQASLYVFLAVGLGPLLGNIKKYESMLSNLIDEDTTLFSSTITIPTNENKSYLMNFDSSIPIITLNLIYRGNLDRASKRDFVQEDEFSDIVVYMIKNVGSDATIAIGEACVKLYLELRDCTERLVNFANIVDKLT